MGVKRICALIMGGAFCLCATAMPIRSGLGGDGVDCEVLAEESEPNTDYIYTTGHNRATQTTGVYVGPQTELNTGASVVIDFTVVEPWDTENATMFAYVGNYGYTWFSLSGAEDLPVGRHIVKWTCQSEYTYYHVQIDGRDSLGTYRTIWRVNGQNRFRIGNIDNGAGKVFHGNYHSVKIYDSLGRLRHCWLPDPSGCFCDVVSDTMTEKAAGLGKWVYGDDADEE